MSDKVNEGAYVGRGTEERLAQSFLHEGDLGFVALRRDGTTVFISAAVRSVLGYEPEDLIGKSIRDLLHPDDRDRAALQLSTAQSGDILTGSTRFTLRHASGRWVPIEIFGMQVTDGREDLIGLYARSALHHVVLEDIVARMLEGLTRAELLAPVCDVVQWQGLGSQLAISWEDDSGVHQVSTGLPEALGGSDAREESPWIDCRHAPDPVKVTGDVSDLDPDLAAIADEAGLSMYWIEPVIWSDVFPAAAITVWTTGGTVTPELHSYGMGVARSMVELILRWTEQLADLGRAARLDSLTGLANRRAFFSSLAEHNSGALLYCDLDRFKPVNDSFGHAAGDTLLRLVARRIESCVREGDLVARLGGDEFAVLCADANTAVAADVASRIRRSLEVPFAVAGHHVEISVSIGIAASVDDLGEDVLEDADRALLAAKAAGRGVVRHASP